MECRRGRPPKRSLLRPWLTSDENLEEQTPWVRINIIATAFRPHTLFNYDNPEEHDQFDAETEIIKC